MEYGTMDATRVGSTLRQLRTARGESVDDFANAIGASVSAVSMYETGRRIPRDEIKIRIADHYKTSVESIFFAK